MYNALDETSEDYPEKLQEFFKEYNKLGPVKRKVVDIENDNKKKQTLLLNKINEPGFIINCFEIIIS